MSASCESCESPSVTRISITMAEGDVVDFTSCHRCEHRTWQEQGDGVEAGDSLEVAHVLDKTRKHPAA